MLVRYRQPWSLSSRIDAEFDRLVAGTFRSGRVNSPATDITADGNDVVITVDVPGLGAEDVDVTLTGRRLTLSGRRAEATTADGESVVVRGPRRAELRRGFTVPAGTTPEQVTATVDNGVLTVRVARVTEPAPEPHRIAVTGGTSTPVLEGTESDTE